MNEQETDAKLLVACRAELQAKADALAQSTARLAKIEGAAAKAVAAAALPSNAGTDLDLVKTWPELARSVVALAEALK